MASPEQNFDHCVQLLTPLSHILWTPITGIANVDPEMDPDVSSGDLACLWRVCVCDPVGPWQEPHARFDVLMNGKLCPELKRKWTP